LLLPPDSPEAQVERHTQLPALAFIKYKIGIQTNVSKLQITAQRIAVYSVSVFVFRTHHIEPNTKAQFAREVNANPGAVHGIKSMINKSITVFYPHVGLIFLRKKNLQGIKQLGVRLKSG